MVCPSTVSLPCRLAGCLAVACSLLASCQDPLLSKVDQEKPATAVSWSDRRIDQTPAVQFALQRSAVLTCGYADVVADVSNGRTKVVQKVGVSGNGCAAVAIAPDGYFLTAGHCIGEQPILVLPLTDGRHAAVPARVVFSYPSGSDTAAQPAALADFAIVHAETPTPCYAECATELKPDAPVLCIGSGLGSSSVSSGFVRGADQYHAGRIAVNVAFHDAPVYRGDSGGPVFDALGKLVGISVSTEYGMKDHPQSEAQLPDPAEMMRLIQEDRVSRAAHPRP